MYPVFWLSLLLFILAFVWKGKMRKRLSCRYHFHIILIYISNHVNNIVFTLIGGHLQILPLIIPFAVVQLGILWWIFKQGGKVEVGEKEKNKSCLLKKEDAEEEKKRNE
jgi:cbb3-type cytochrome oxidase subunit 3